MKSIKTTLCWISLLMTFSPALLQAQDCSLGSDIIPDGSVETGTVRTSSVVHRQFIPVAGHSYSVQLTTSIFELVPMTVAVNTLIGDANVCEFAGTTDTSSMGPRAVSGSSFAPIRQRLAFYAATSDRITIELNNTSTVFPGDYKISLIDTTLFSPGWSTNGTANTYWSFTNTGSAPTQAFFRLVDATGLLRATRSAVINPGATFSTNTFDLAVDRMQNGSAMLAYDGPPGTITATAVINVGGANPQYVPFGPRPE